jgi:hypothetical protein
MPTTHQLLPLLGTAPGGHPGPAADAEGHVRADFGGHGVQVDRRQVQPPQPVQRDQGGRTVGAAAAEPGRDGDALAQPEAGPGQVAGAAGQLAGRDQDQVGLVGRQAAALDLEAEPLGHDLDLQLVPDGDRLQHRDDLVVAAVGAQRPDVQAKVDLGGGAGPERGRGPVVCLLALLTGHERPSPTSMPGHGSCGR